MNWKKQLEGYENEKNWSPAIDLMELTIRESPNDVEAYIRVIYLLHNILVEEELTNLQLDTDTMVRLLTKYFNDSKNIFINNPEYLFFIGQILYISDWYFGVDEDFIPIEETTAFRMQKKAFEIETGNMLFEWSCLYSSKNKDADYLAYKIFVNDSIMNWLKSKGFPGKYIISNLNMSRQRYVELT